MKIKIKNDKSRIDWLQDIGLIWDSSEIFRQIISSHRIIPEESLLNIRIKDKNIELEYDDYSKFDIRELLKGTYTKGIGGAGGRNLREAYGTILKDIKYIQIDNKRSKVIFELYKDVGNIDREYDISKYLKDDKEFYVEIMDIPNEIYSLGTKEERENGRCLLFEFILNLAHHNFRKHNKYITIDYTK